VTSFTVTHAGDTLVWWQDTTRKYSGRKGETMSGEATTQEEHMTGEELETFTRKLEAFTESLTAKERALLLQVLIRAGAEDAEDVEAHALSPRSLAAAALALQARWAKQPPQP
jgi:hypothetical protein